VKVALISTFLNEAGSMPAFLAGIEAQTRKPDEIILVDGGSTDGSDRIAARHPGVTLLRVPGNRSAGRNAALAATDADVIAATDLGCALEATWLEHIVEPLEADAGIDVVAGWTVPPPLDERVRASVAVLTVPIERVDPASTRPSTRSVAFRRTRVHPFPEGYSHNEDAVWFVELRRRGLRFAFARDARVAWNAPRGPRRLYRVVARYGRGDGDAGLDPRAYLKVAGELSALGLLAAASLRFWTARLGLVAGWGYFTMRMRRRAISTLGSPSAYQALVRVPAYGLVVKAAQVAGYARGSLERRLSRRASPRPRRTAGRDL